MPQCLPQCGVFQAGVGFEFGVGDAVGYEDEDVWRGVVVVTDTAGDVGFVELGTAEELGFAGIGAAVGFAEQVQGAAFRLPQGSGAIANLVGGVVPAAVRQGDGKADEQGAGEAFRFEAVLLCGFEVGFVRGMQGVADEVGGDFFALRGVYVGESVVWFVGVVQQGDDGVFNGFNRLL